ncbi:hypothetical protein FFWV33_05545 [Flavobacterium faecale]|uniref:Uncharacterized protein n=1 Tax=Flavobacterium faecale TaxID=1355330 RepID=A0A2S1LB90_9FLAO|nr:3-oxoacyl-ACP reductase [Flavobacterium faecale]AWG21033.1 hypothetical protein FFWV33_05545 [Flavobacterium faecale]
MKKAILASGLFSLVMVLSSFTTVEATSNVEVGGNKVAIAGQGATSKMKFDIAGQGATSKMKFDIAGQGATSKMKFDIAGQGATSKMKFD